MEQAYKLIGCMKFHSSLQLWLLSVSGAQMQSSVERPCPGERVTFTCTIPSPGHQWNIQSLGISRSLLHRDQGRVITDHPPFQFNVTEVISGTSITSTATVNATADLNGTLVVCRDGVGTLSDQSITINLRGEYSILLYAYKYVVG